MTVILFSLIMNRTYYMKAKNKIRAQVAKKTKLLFQETILDAAVLYFDGKIVPDIVTCQKIDRLLIIVSNVKVGKMLRVPASPNRTGKDQAEAIYRIVFDWEVYKSIKAVCRDTTNSNVGC